MDRLTIVVLVLCVALMLFWGKIVNTIYPPKAIPAGLTNRPSATLLEDTNRATSTLSSSTNRLPVPSFVANTNIAEERIMIANESARYTFTSRGGGLATIELLKYPEDVLRKDSGPVRLNAEAKAPTLALIDGSEVQGDGNFTITKTDRGGVRAEKTLPNGLTIVKEFRPSSNYLVAATVTLANHSDKPLTLPAVNWIVGTASPLTPQDDGTAVGVMWSDGSKVQDLSGQTYFSKSGFACMPKIPPFEYSGGESNVVWAAAHNQFFALAVLPSHPETKIIVNRLELPPPSAAVLQTDSRINKQPVAYQASLVSQSVTLAPNATSTNEFLIFAGPKEYKTLAEISEATKSNLEAIMNFGWVGFFSKALLLGMNWIHSVLKVPYGWCVVVITVLIKVVFWPLTAFSTRSAKRMQALQPQVKAIQDKYKEDPMKAQQKVMAFYKEQKVSPLAGCFPTLIQMPVFFGFLVMIRTAIELRGASFLWAHDLSRPDTVWMIPGLHFPLNPLPLIMGVTMLWQSHLTPPSPGMDPAQAKMMRYMPLIFLIFLYNFSAGLALYWTVNNLLSVLQTKLTKTNPTPAAAVAAPGKPSPKVSPLTGSQKKRR